MSYCFLSTFPVTKTNWKSSFRLEFQFLPHLFYILQMEASESQGAKKRNVKLKCHMLPTRSNRTELVKRLLPQLHHRPTTLWFCLISFAGSPYIRSKQGLIPLLTLPQWQTTAVPFPIPILLFADLQSPSSEHTIKCTYL